MNGNLYVSTNNDVNSKQKMQDTGNVCCFQTKFALQRHYVIKINISIISAISMFQAMNLAIFNFIDCTEP